VLAAGALLLPAGASGSPRVTLAPAFGPAGSRAVVAGAGWGRGRRLTVRVAGGARVARRAGRHGGFRVAVRIPRSARGGVAVVTRSRRLRARNAFHVGRRVRSGQVASVRGPVVLWRAAPGRLRLRGERLGARRRVVVRVGGAVRRRLRAGRRGRVAVSLPVAGAGRGSLTAGRVRLPFRFSVPPARQPAFPIRAAFYYPWFPEAWSQRGIDPFTHFHPSAGFYSTDAAATLRRQIRQMRYGRIEAGIASWWGRGTRSDGRMPALLRAAARTPFRWAIYYEPEGQGDPSPAAIRTDLRYIRRRYARDPSYLRVHGRFVVFVWADGGDGPAMARRWRAANNVGAYVVLKVFSGYRDVAAQPDGWHQYAPASPEDSQAGRSFTVSPGFWHAAESAPRLARSAPRFAASVRRMVASRAPWQLVTTFNEWGEGTAVEPAREWSSASGRGDYLDVLHRDGR
jgi:hypothetical protein